jgi:hypothetical protein
MSMPMTRPASPDGGPRRPDRLAAAAADVGHGRTGRDAGLADRRIVRPGRVVVVEHDVGAVLAVAVPGVPARGGVRGKTVTSAPAPSPAITTRSARPHAAAVAPVRRSQSAPAARIAAARSSAKPAAPPARRAPAQSACRYRRR